MFQLRPYERAESQGRPVGFADMTRDGHLDRSFVAASHQRQGVATSLIERMIEHARETGIQAIETDASITAKPFFERFGFAVRRQQSVACRGAKLTNYRMTRIIDWAPPILAREISMKIRCHVAVLFTATVALLVASWRPAAVDACTRVLWNDNSLAAAGERRPA